MNEMKCSKCGHKYKALRIGEEACCKESREDEFKLRQARDVKEHHLDRKIDACMKELHKAGSKVGLPDISYPTKDKAVIDVPVFNSVKEREVE